MTKEENGNRTPDQRFGFGSGIKSFGRKAYLRQQIPVVQCMVDPGGHLSTLRGSERLSSTQVASGLRVKFPGGTSVARKGKHVSQGKVPVFVLGI